MEVVFGQTRLTNDDEEQLLKVMNLEAGAEVGMIKECTRPLQNKVVFLLFCCSLCLLLFMFLLLAVCGGCFFTSVDN